MTTYATVETALPAKHLLKEKINALAETAQAAELELRWLKTMKLAPAETAQAAKPELLLCKSTCNSTTHPWLKAR